MRHTTATSTTRTLAIAIQLAVLACGCRHVHAFTAGTFTAADADPDGGGGSVEAAVDKAMQDAILRYNIRGASIAYYNGNAMDAPIVRGYGQLSSAAGAPAVDGATVFMIASVSKVFAGVAVSTLVDRGVIDLDDDICDTLDGLDLLAAACRNPHAKDTKITWRMLVTHRSSMASSLPGVEGANGGWAEATYAPAGGYEGGPAVGNPSCPLEETLTFYKDFLTDVALPTTKVGALATQKSGQPINWYALGQADGGAWKKETPGSSSEYSNAAFGYLAPLIALEAGKTFPEFSKEAIFAKLGMENTAWFRRDLPEGVAEAVPNLYSSKTGAFADLPGPDGGHYCFVDYASGSLHTSAADLSKFSMAMLDYGAGTVFEKIKSFFIRCRCMSTVFVFLCIFKRWSSMVDVDLPKYEKPRIQPPEIRV